MRWLTSAYDSLQLCAMLAGNLSQGAASIAVALRIKNKDMKSVATASGISALTAGITEPALYGVTLRLKRPAIASAIGAGISGLFIGIVKLRAYAFTTPSLMAMPMYLGPGEAGVRNLIYAIIAAVISIVVTFVMTLVLGWDDPVDEDEEDDDTTEATETTADGKIVIAAPIKGEIIPLESVNDATFSTGILGNGYAIIPSEGKVYAPFDGVCEQLFDTLHALCLKSKSGAEVLIHVGLETVSLEGKPFKAHIKSGDSIKKGDLLLEFDIDAIKAAGCEISTPVIVSNEDEIGSISIVNDSIVIGG